MSCRVGVQLPEVERAVPWPEMVAIAGAAENAGFDSIWLGDHLLYDLPNGASSTERPLGSPAADPRSVGSTGISTATNS